MDDRAASAILNKLSKAASSSQLRQEAIRDAALTQLSGNAFQTALKLFALGSAAGAGTRGAVGLYNLMRRSLNPPKRFDQSVEVIDVPFPVGKSPQWALYHRTQEEKKKKEKTAGVLDFLKGMGARSESGIPWSAPLATLALGGGGVFGYSALDHILDARRKAEMQAEVEEAKKKYREALLAQYDLTPEQVKTPKLAAALDRFCDVAMEKAAAGDTVGSLAGLYGVYALLTGLPSAALMYEIGKRRSSGYALQKALKQRARQRLNERPPEFFARAVPVETDTDPADVEKDVAGTLNSMI